MQQSRWFERAGFGAAFAGVHLVLWWLTTVTANLPLGDVTITYRRWIETGLSFHFWVGMDSDWVYPILAIVPMAAAAIGGVASIGTGWLVLMVVLDAVACAFLWRFRALGVRVVWWWLVFLLALGPIGLGRIDTVATAVALVGVCFVASRPAVASAVFTVAAWVEVWPAALVGVLLVLRRGHRAGVLTGALTVTALVVLVDVLFGGAAHLLSFIGQQSGRALQIEAPLATPFMWAAAAHVPGAAVFYDTEILTFEVSGTGTHLAAAVSTPLMALVVVAGVVLAAWAVGRGARRAEVAPVLALLLVAALVATNKVGSPQYIGWFAVPIVWGLIAGRGSARRFLPVAVAALPMALLTQLVYPGWYDQVLTVQPWILVVLTVRNALEVAILVWAVVAVVRLGLRGASGHTARRLGSPPRVWSGPRVPGQDGRMIVAFSVAPSGGPSEQPDGSVHDAVAAAVRVVRESGLPNHTSSMFTEVEGEWDEVMAVVKAATEAVGAFGTRVSLVLKADIRPGYTGELEGKVARLETALEGGS